MCVKYRFMVQERSSFQEWCADDVLNYIAHEEIKGRELTRDRIEEIADRMGCRIIWLDEGSKDSVKIPGEVDQDVHQ